MKQLILLLLICITYTANAVDITNFWVQQRNPGRNIIYWTSLDESDVSAFILYRNGREVFHYEVEHQWLSSVYYCDDRDYPQPFGWYYELVIETTSGAYQPKAWLYVGPQWYWKYLL